MYEKLPLLTVPTERVNIFSHVEILPKKTKRKKTAEINHTKICALNHKCDVAFADGTAVDGAACFGIFMNSGGGPIGGGPIPPGPFGPLGNGKPDGKEKPEGNGKPPGPPLGNPPGGKPPGGGPIAFGFFTQPASLHMLAAFTTRL